MKEKLQHILDRINEIGGEINELVFEKPAAINDIEKIEIALGYPLPPDF